MENGAVAGSSCTVSGKVLDAESLMRTNRLGTNGMVSSIVLWKVCENSSLV